MKHFKLPLYVMCAFLVTLTFTQCGDRVSACDTTTCSGCCDDSGACQACQPPEAQTPDASTLTPETDAGTNPTDAGTTLSCAAPLKACDNSCVDTQMDGSHCGACGNVCAEGTACKAGKCETLPPDCTAPSTPCPSTGFYCDTTSKQCKAGCVSDSQCAGQNVACDTATRTCGCETGFHACSSACVSNTSVNSCGNSCTPCPAAPANGSATCESGACGFQCNTGYGVCGNSCCKIPTWTQRTDSNPPPGSEKHAMAYDSDRKKVILFGGHGWSGGIYFNDTWEWDGATWTQLNLSNAPSVRRWHSMVYDSDKKKVILFGGWGANRFNDTWELE